MVCLAYIDLMQYGSGNSNCNFKRRDTMKAIYITTSLVISAMVFLSSACVGSKHNGETKQEYTGLDSTWLPFAKAMESKDIKFLIENSLDSLTCYDCSIDSANQKVLFDSEFIIKNHLNKIMHLPSLTDKSFKTYQDKNEITIVYSVKSFYSPEGAYCLFFTLIKKGKKYYFEGMSVQ